MTEPKGRVPVTTPEQELRAYPLDNEYLCMRVMPSAGSQTTETLLADQSIRDQACWLADRAGLKLSTARGAWVDACSQVIDAAYRRGIVDGRIGVARAK